MKFTDIISSLRGSGTANGVVGVDIGSSAMKVVELQDREGVITLTNYGELQLGPYAEKELGETVSLDATQEQKALADLIRESAIQANSAVFAMPLSSSFVTNVSIAADADADLSAMVRVEARKVIPASLSEVTLDWAEVESMQAQSNTEQSGDEKEGAQANRDVLIAAIQNAALERFKVLMKFVGLPEPPAEIECFSAIRSVYETEKTDVAIIDIGAESAKLYLSHKGLLMRMHRVRAGGNIATQEIAKALNCSFAEAEAKKYAADTSDKDFMRLKRAHNDSYGRAFREFSQVLREYERKTGVELSVVHLSGGAAVFPGIDRLLQESIQRDVQVVKPFSRVAYPAFMEDTLRQIGPSFVVALGAALRQLE